MNYKEAIKQGQLLLLNAKPDQALSCAKEAIKQEPNRLEGYILAGKAEFEMTHYLSAIHYFESAQFYGKLDAHSQKIYEIAKRFQELPSGRKMPGQTGQKNPENPDQQKNPENPDQHQDIQKPSDTFKKPRKTLHSKGSSDPCCCDGCSDCCYCCHYCHDCWHCDQLCQGCEGCGTCEGCDGCGGCCEGCGGCCEGCGGCCEGCGNCNC